MRTFSDLRSANVERQKLYCENADKLSLSYWGNAIAGETGELCNLLKKLDREAMGLKGSRAKLEDVGDEIADVYIYLDLLCHKLGLEQAVIIAAKFNATSRKLGFDVELYEDPRHAHSS